MKLLRHCLMLTGVLLAATTTALHAEPASFEGKIKMQLKADKNAQILDYSVKPNLMRVDMPAGKNTTATSIMDFAKKEMIVLMPGEKMYMVMPLREGGDANAQTKPDKASSFEKTGETEKILGYLCSKFISKDDKNTYEIWAAEGLGTFMNASGGNPMKPAARSAWEAELAEKGFFPLRIVGRNDKGKETFQMEALAIEKQKLPDSVFTVPEGYQRFDMGNMLKGMGNPFSR